MAAERWPVQVPIMMRAEHNTPVEATLLYTPRDPWAVSVLFACGYEETIAWTFSRELLAAGLDWLAGLADVQLWPDRGRIMLRLSSPDGDSLLAARHKDLAGFLALTYRWVAPGDEPRWVDVDAAVARVLEEADR